MNAANSHNTGRVTSMRDFGASVLVMVVMRSFSPSFRGDAKHRTRNLEIPGLVLRTIPE
jgi:hypothetical protein